MHLESIQTVVYLTNLFLILETSMKHIKHLRAVNTVRDSNQLSSRRKKHYRQEIGSGEGEEM